MNVARFLTAAARSFPTAPAISSGARQVATYAELAAKTARLAGGSAAALRLAPGDRVLLAMSNDVEYFAVLFACWQAGFVAVPVNAKLHPSEMAYVAEDCGARVCFASGDLAQTLAAALPDRTRLVVLGDSLWESLVHGEGAGVVEREAHDPAWIFYTSGTTGRPKGAVLTHRNLHAMAVAYLADVDFLSPADTFLHVAAQSHATGLFGLSHVAKAAHHVLPESRGFDPAEIAALLERHASVTLFVPPTGLRRLMRHPQLRAGTLPGLRTLLLGAAPLYVADLRAAFATFGARVWNGYGQGESPCTITAMSKMLLARAIASDDDARIGSVGIARTGIEVAIRNADSAFEAAGTPGEVVVRGDTVMAGYWNAPQATAETLRGGWLHTGDLGVLDDGGYLTLLDRSKDVIISGGVNIYPREVETVLMLDPAVDEVAVVGVPDDEWGESVLAFLVARAGAQIDVAALERRCLENIARFKRPRHWRIVDELPKNAAGKVLKRDLQARFRAETGSALAALE